MSETVRVFLWPEKPVGRLWFRSWNGRESATFQYDPDWLDPENFALEPVLDLNAGTFHTDNMPLFGSMGDSAPARWGRILMLRSEERRAKAAGKTPRPLTELDFLFGVNDEARQGALRFKIQDDGPFLAPPEPNAIPPLAALPRLLSASERFLESRESEEDLQLLLAPGSSLGGARPKASVYDSGDLSIAKFPRKDDEFQATLWEALALTLAEKAGIQVPSWRIEKALNKPVLVLKRFDRQGQRRIPFLSAMGMLGARDHEQHSYLEIARAITQHGAQPLRDLEELWRRLVFSICISNVDDHLRNHGFLLITPTDGNAPKGWRLSPAYDLNPVPRQAGPHSLSLAIDAVSREASLETALSVIGEFRLEKEKTMSILDEVRYAVDGWQNAALSLGISRRETTLMASAFAAQ
jgi:serine/threonine-protein kinase HipA